MTRTVLRDPRLDSEFLALPSAVRDECWRVIAALRRRPLSPGAGFRVERLRRAAPTEAWSAHFSDNQYRLLYVLDGDAMILLGVGARPGSYPRLDRIRGRRSEARSPDSG